MAVMQTTILWLAFIFLGYKVIHYHNSSLVDINAAKHGCNTTDWLLKQNHSDISGFGQELCAHLLLSPTPVVSFCSQIRSHCFLTELVLLLSGDISPNPGPGPKFPCTVCQKGVRSNSKATDCNVCHQWTHLKCQSLITASDYSEAVDGTIDLRYTCSQCTLAELPQLLQDDLDLDHSLSTYPEMNTSHHSNDNLYQFECFKKRGLLFIHVNIRSLLPKLDDLQQRIVSTRAAVVAVTETWLNDSVPDEEIRMPDYVVERWDRNRDGGGVCLYIHKNFACNQCEDLVNADLEFFAVD